MLGTHGPFAGPLVMVTWGLGNFPGVACRPTALTPDAGTVRTPAGLRALNG